MSTRLHNIHFTSQSDLQSCQVGGVGLDSRRGRGRPPVPLVDRFWSKVNTETPSGCWLWTSNRHRNGYGQIALCRNGAPRQRWAWAHRIAYELSIGPIATGLLVLHHCDTPLCVNPAHLFLGTQQDNIADAMQKGRLTGRPRTRVGAATFGD